MSMLEGVWGGDEGRRTCVVRVLRDGFVEAGFAEVAQDVEVVVCVCGGLAVVELFQS